MKIFWNKLEIRSSKKTHQTHRVETSLTQWNGTVLKLPAVNETGRDIAWRQRLTSQWRVISQQRVVLATCSDWVRCERKTVKIGRLRIPNFIFFRINQGFILSMKMFRLLRKRRQRYFPRVFPQHWLILSFHHEYRFSALAGWPRPRSRRKCSLFATPEQQQHCSCCWISGRLQLVNRFCLCPTPRGLEEPQTRPEAGTPCCLFGPSLYWSRVWPVLYVQGHSTEIYWCLYCIPECGVSLSFDLLRYRSISPPVCNSGIGKSAHLD